METNSNSRPQEFDAIVMHIIETNHINPFGNHWANWAQTRKELREIIQMKNIEYQLTPNDQVLWALLATIAQENNWEFHQ